MSALKIMGEKMIKEFGIILVCTAIVLTFSAFVFGVGYLLAWIFGRFAILFVIVPALVWLGYEIARWFRKEYAEAKLEADYRAKRAAERAEDETEAYAEHARREANQ